MLQEDEKNQTDFATLAFNNKENIVAFLQQEIKDRVTLQQIDYFNNNNNNKKKKESSNSNSNFNNFDAFYDHDSDDDCDNNNDL